ncbi:MAG: twin-arginine translocase subunit TatB [Geminicoccaceae bacterium]|nr:twin-arginine translocase subunit TatB [Geminicoccaceae bacterium]
MFDLGWSEMAVIMLVALIVIGPKDLPKVAKTIGHWTGRARALARDFQRSIDDMAREAELDEIKKSIDRTGRIDLRKTISDAVDPKGELARAFDVEDKAKPGKVGKTAPAKPRIEAPAAPAGPPAAVADDTVTSEPDKDAATLSDGATTPRS